MSPIRSEIDGDAFAAVIDFCKPNPAAAARTRVPFDTNARRDSFSDGDVFMRLADFHDYRSGGHNNSTRQRGFRGRTAKGKSLTDVSGCEGGTRKALKRCRVFEDD